MPTTQFAASADELARLVPHAAKVALFKDCGVPMALGCALVRQGVRALHIVTVPTGGILPDMLIGAGCVATIETAGVTLGEFGLAPRFTEAVKQAQVRILDATCPALYAGLQAAEKGIPFMPLRGLIGSDIVAARSDFRIIDNPFGADDPIVLLPAIAPDVALFHAPYADRSGNVYVGRQKELKLLAHAARKTLVTVERVVEFNLLERDEIAAASLNALYVDAIAVAPRGAWPSNLPGPDEVDRAAVADYAQAAASADGFATWLGRMLRLDAAA
jgi:glutaconate CoA-transferase subunit A